jgi:hypothetical protein
VVLRWLRLQNELTRIDYLHELCMQEAWNIFLPVGTCHIQYVTVGGVLGRTLSG